MAPVDNIRRGIDADVRQYLERAQNDPQLRDAMARGDVQQIMRALPAGVTRDDILEFLKYRSVELEQTVIQQWTQIKAGDATIPPPDAGLQLLPIDAQSALDSDDQQVVKKLLFGGKGAKTLGGGKAAPTAATPEDAAAAEAALQAGGQHLLDEVRGQLGDDEAFLSNIEEQIFNVQLGMELEQKQHEAKEQFQRIVAMMRAGLVDPEFVLLALAKAQISERGVLYTQLGRRVMRINEQQTKIAGEIGLKTDLGAMEQAKQELQGKTMDMNQMMSLMQKVTQDIDSIMGTTKSMLEEYNRTKLEIKHNIGK